MSSRPPSDRNQDRRINRWTHVEEVFLIGAVMQRWFAYGSFTRGKNEAENSWEAIGNSYNSLWRSYYEQNRTRRPVSRTSTALSRHFKIMKRNLNEGESLRSLYLEFELKYNYENFSKFLREHLKTNAVSPSNPIAELLAQSREPPANTLDAQTNVNEIKPSSLRFEPSEERQERPQEVPNCQNLGLEVDSILNNTDTELYSEDLFYLPK